MKVLLVEKFSDLNGISEKEIEVEADELEILASCSIIFHEKRTYRIKERAFNTNGTLLLFVENDKSYPIDTKFINFYFES
ncbi:hypothetical protein M3197_12205 [Sporosarcina aquimarina]|uniref:hypothetical protein n=1 Tax=Sporosarcina aquimarina TaxID=114975 RepID=UPI00204259B6|nr:hypothetical protein [Sporosarcina aquimarina]MCM3758226.1 hypothetical protein [Sporosarcina aquimarina]